MAILPSFKILVPNAPTSPEPFSDLHGGNPIGLTKKFAIDILPRDL
jgi:hypothetical protein